MRRDLAAGRAAGYNAAMNWLLPASVAVAVASILATGLLRSQLRRRAILDHPNERSSHAAPTPRGAGLAIVPIVLIAWLAGPGDGATPELALVVAGAAALAALSWIDDLRSLPAGLRFAGQAAMVALAMTGMAERGPVFQGLLPGWLDLALTAIGWLWFINLFNFMDGIDGLAGVEAASIGGGLALLSLLAPLPAPWLGLSIAAAAAGFLVWNWHPARIFLGDVGSVPLGFLLGWLLLSAAAEGLWAPALILPLYYLADATLTLLRRALRGERVWRAHREHFYQRAVQGGASHARVALAVLATNCILIGLAAAATAAPGFSLAAAAIVTALLLVWMRR